MLRPKNRNSAFRWPAKEILALSAGVAAIYVLVCLATYAEFDPTWRFVTESDDAPVQNLGGHVGAVLADLLFMLAGWVAFLVPLGLLVFAAQLFAFRKVIASWSNRTTNFSGYLAMLFGLCILAEAHLGPPISVIESQGGGLAGMGVFELARTTLPIEVTMAVALLLVVTGMGMMQGFSWLWVCERLGSAAVACTAGVANRIAGGIARRHLPKASAVAEESNEAGTPLRVARESSLPKKLKPKRGSGRKLSDGIPSISPAEPASEKMTAQGKQATRKTKAGKRRITPSFGVPTASKGSQTRSRAGMAQLRQTPVKQSVIPALDLLDKPEQNIQGAYTESDLQEMAETLIEKLADFGVGAEVASIQPGPVITRFEVQPAPGTKVSKFTGLAKDLARALLVSSVRIVEIIPGRSTVGIEIPNQTREIVRLQEILSTAEYANSTSPLTLALGKDVSGRPVYADITRMPHLLVAGTTGSGKSVGINAILISILFKSTPEEVRFILIDPKMLELSVYEGIPHLLTPVVTNMQEAGQSLYWCVAEMERRYRLMASFGVRNLDRYNDRVRRAREKGQPLLDPFWTGPETSEAPELEHLPLIVVVIDEFADMMMIVGKKIDQTIARIAQKARAAGIHLVLATQRPSVDVITGLIKANINCRIGFLVPSKVDSRTILDQGGAEQLLGYGDMLYMSPGSGIPERVHGAFVSDNEVHRVVAAWKKRGAPEYMHLASTQESPAILGGGFDGQSEQDEHYDEAVAFVLDRRSVSISSVQRKFRIGYNRAANLVEAMEASGLVSPPGHNGSREVLVPETA